MRRRLLLLLAILALVFAVLAMISPSQAGISIHVRIETQTMTVSLDGTQLYEWPVSTAKRGAVTPRGTYTAQWLSRHHRSRKYGWAPMPNAVFYSGNYAIHGTMDEHLIGRPASRGCVRLSVGNSKILFELVERHGAAKTTIVISD